MIAGCGGTASTLEGSVTIDGQPAPAGISVQFESTGGGTSAYAMTDADGHYEASETFRSPGIAPGTYRVRLMPNSEATTPPSFAPGRKEPVRAVRTFPDQAYRELEIIEVKPGRNRHDIALPTGGKKPANQQR